jgi:hypothetical protein
VEEAAWSNITMLSSRSLAGAPPLFLLIFLVSSQDRRFSVHRHTELLDGLRVLGLRSRPRQHEHVRLDL